MNASTSITEGEMGKKRSGDRAEESGTPVVRPLKLHVHQRDGDHDTAKFKGSNKTRRNSTSDSVVN